ncbi:hypothetical protein FQV37_1666 [Psychrobacter nivimaris]|uniref:Uncharacterized protein n=1 Tax=Psychrobacter nivimaris TaxID=281738 RepID=A0A6N7BY45_9GAMM|nr:hypothetical protein FQV37_1666 [Psychrobacter nivimaris]
MNRDLVYFTRINIQLLINIKYILYGQLYLKNKFWTEHGTYG